tara:strand:- start:21373 stop:21933 length:561 start_codon:yes stop_codon:yes gene_type:complete
MQEIFNLFNSDKRWLIATIIGLIGLYFGYKRIRIMSRKDKIDKTDFDNKKSNFSLYLHQGYRLFDKDKQKLKFLLINIDISNKSSSKITVSPYIYVKLKGVNEKIKLLHDKHLFLEKYHSKIEKFDNNISIEEKGKKSGWIITEIPYELIDKRIEYIEIFCEDTLGNVSKVEFYLLKDIYYEDTKN